MQYIMKGMKYFLYYGASFFLVGLSVFLEIQVRIIELKSTKAFTGLTDHVYGHITFYYTQMSVALFARKTLRKNCAFVCLEFRHLRNMPECLGMTE